MNFSYLKTTSSLPISGSDTVETSIEYGGMKNNEHRYSFIRSFSPQNSMNRIPSKGAKKQKRNFDEHYGNTEFWSERGGKNGQNLPSMLAAMFPSITDATLRLQPKTLRHVFATLDEIGESLKRYYIGVTLRQIYNIIGSLDFVGNPSMALNSIMTGVRDFFYQPSMALLKSHQNPSELGLGVVRGTLSLVSNSASGVLGFASKFSETFGHLAAFLSMDRTFQLKHKEDLMGYAHSKRVLGTRHLLFMASRPVKDIGKGIFLAATGVVIEPYKGAKKEGATGLAKGVGIGTIGIVAKPLVGIFDALSHATDSIQYIAKSVNLLEKKFAPIQKRRLPYIFGYGNILLPFNQVDARSMEILGRLPLNRERSAMWKKSFGNTEEYLINAERLSMNPRENIYIILSSKRLVLVEIKKENGSLNMSLRHEFDVSEISSRIENEGYNGVALYINHKDKNNDSSDIIFEENIKSPIGSIFSGSDDNIDPIGSIALFENEFEDSLRNNGKYTQVFMGEFRHRPHLVRIHNAICCISRQFMAIIHESGNEHGDSGIYNIGHMTFQRDDGQIPGKRNKFNDDLFYSALNNANWLVGERLSDTLNKTDHDHVSTSWLEDAFLKAISLPSDSSSGKFEENSLKNKKDSVSTGKTPSASKIKRIKKAEEMVEDPSTSLFTEMSTSEIMLFNRLDKVEVMLEKLVQNQTQGGKNTKQAMDDTGISIISSLGDHGVEDNISKKNLNSVVSNEVLLREIDTLKREVKKLSNNESQVSTSTQSKAKSNKKKHSMLPFKRNVRK